MSIIGTINQILGQLRPFITMIAMVFGVIAAWHGLAELMPVAKQIWSPRGSAQSMAIVGAALAIIAGRA
jgi:hypothetical protein